MGEIASKTDFYKTVHPDMHNKDTTVVMNNLTGRRSMIQGVNDIIVFGNQYYIKKYLLEEWQLKFFFRKKADVIGKFKRLMDHTLGKDVVGTQHLIDLHDLGFIPMEMRALPEGSRCPIGVPCIVMTTTHGKKFSWVTQYLESIFSCIIWKPITSATIADNFHTLLMNWAKKTCNDGAYDFVKFQAHDFSFRGMPGVECAELSGAAHLLSFYGTDTIPAIEFLEEWYGADIEKEMVGTSVPATEHAVMCLRTGIFLKVDGGDWDKYGEAEFKVFESLLDQYPTGILSVVSDTWNLWTVLTEFLPRLKDKIMARDGKLVIRPDSGDPADIVCGFEGKTSESFHKGIDTIAKAARYFKKSESEIKGVVELLYDTFGGTTNERGHIELDSHIGCIYGDSITYQRANNILQRLSNKGFASNNIVFGVGSFTYQYNTRDTFGFAVKATYGEVEHEGKIIPVEIFKDPITDDGTKKSARGITVVNKDVNGKFILKDQATWEEYNSETNELKVVFLDGKLIKDQTLNEIRNQLHESKS